MPKLWCAHMRTASGAASPAALLVCWFVRPPPLSRRHPFTTNPTAAAHPPHAAALWLLQDPQVMDELMDEGELMDEWEPPAAAPQPAAASQPAPAAASQPAEQQRSSGGAMPSPVSRDQDAPRAAHKRTMRGEWADTSSTPLAGYSLAFCSPCLSFLISFCSMHHPRLQHTKLCQQKVVDNTACSFGTPTCCISATPCAGVVCCRLVR